MVAVSAYSAAVGSSATAAPIDNIYLADAATEACSSLGESIGDSEPQSASFQNLVNAALNKGCAAYVADGGALYVEMLRGSMVGSAKTIGPTHSGMFDIALTPTGLLYGVSSSGGLYAVNRETGAASAIGSGSGSLGNALAVSSAGTIYAAGSSALMSVDPNTGIGSAVGAGIGYSSSGDLAFSSGNLYMSSTGNGLIRVDPATGTGVLIGPMGVGSVFGLGDSLGTLYGATSGGELLTISTATGAATRIASGGPGATGMATLPGEGNLSVAPEVTITSHPPKESVDSEAKFAFRGIPGGSYECSIDGGSWNPCQSGQEFGRLVPGDHRFSVRETLDGLTSPADSYSWTIDLPRACILKVARARVFAFAHQGKARLVIHYKAYRPAQVTVSYKLKGARGNLALGSASSHFRKAGVFRLAKLLSRAQTEKLSATKFMKVHFAIPAAPGKCGRYYTKRLTIPKKIFGQTVWFQSDSRFTLGAERQAG